MVHALPLLGIAFLGWSLFSVMLLYWLECTLILLAGMARVCWIGPRPVRNTFVMLLYSPVYLGPAIGSLVAFGIAVVVFFYAPEPILLTDDMPSLGTIGRHIADEWLWVAMLPLVGAHIADFVGDWIKSGAYRTGSIILQMYKLFGVPHLVMILLMVAAFVIDATGIGALAAGVVVFARMGIDVAVHLIVRAIRNEA